MKKLSIIISFIFFILSHSASATETVVLYAAASTSNAITEIVNQFNQATPNIKVKVSFASSSTLAKQIEAGAPADIYISANPSWMDYLQKRQLIFIASRKNLLKNKIVLVAPKGKQIVVKMNSHFDFAKQLTGKLCLGDTAHVPAGIYAKQALVSLGWWSQVKSRVVGSSDARASLALIERGECAAGIVYTTDANASNKIKLIAKFPSKTHKPIVYPAALIASANHASNVFLQYLSSSAATKIFNQYGFGTK
ncbi:MAG: molybdate ABC transporter substrate-binding protein [Methylococcales bacterium]